MSDENTACSSAWISTNVWKLFNLRVGSRCVRCSSQYGPHVWLLRDAVFHNHERKLKGQKLCANNTIKIWLHSARNRVDQDIALANPCTTPSLPPQNSRKAKNGLWLP
ncbi:hypothetical protein IG631_08107 [Alternaria alternata]|nr:hypothetical protein IG631_08107 [Alternaria alternata]